MDTPSLPSAAALNEQARLDEHEVFTRRVEIMIKQARRGGVVILIGVVLIGALLIPVVGVARFALWASLVVGCVGMRAAVLLYIHRKRGKTNSAIQDERVLTVFTFVLGLAVASGVFIFFPVADFKIRVLVMLILCAWAAGGAAILAAHPRSYYWYLASYFPQLAAAWLIYEPDYPIVAALLALFACVLVFLAKEIGRLVVVAATFEKEKDLALDQKDSLILEKDALLRDKDSLLGEKDSLIEAIEAARRHAEEANLSKSRFLAAASHDLRQPVTALSLLVGTLGSLSLDDRGREIVGQAGRAIDSLEELFNAVLDLSRLDAGVVIIEPTTFDLGRLLQELTAEYLRRVDARVVKLTAHSGILYVRTDRIKLERVVRNLLDNALKFTAKGAITVALKPQAEGCVIEVSDTGPGIAEEEQERIFEDFYQSRRSATHRQRGLGLGLAIVRRLGRALGMRTGVRSQPGTGSTFWIELPDSLIAAPVVAAVPDLAAVTIDLRDKVIVVIDDDPSVREALRLTLASWNAMPIVAPDLAGAIGGLRASGAAPDLVIADYELEDGALGTEAIATIRASIPGLPAFLLTGTTVSGTAQIDGIPVLQKPLSYPALARTLSRVFAQD
jgi:signal transduction histidine kinase/CheY-like chemotaxis protein